eukprot:s1814_g14.t1
MPYLETGCIHLSPVLAVCAMRQADVAGSSRAQASTSASRLGPSSASSTSHEPGALSDHPRSAGSPTIPPSPAGSVASGSVGASAAVQPRSVPGQSGPPSESSAGPRHAQISAGDDEGTEVWPDSDPESFLGETYRQNLQDVSAFLDQKELEMTQIFAKMRAQLLQAIPASSSGPPSGKQAVSSRSDEVTAGWRDLGGPFYRALALQREREKENQNLRESVARRRGELDQLQQQLDQLGIPRSGPKPTLAAFSFSNLETSPLAGAVAVAVTPASASQAGQVGQAGHVQFQATHIGASPAQVQSDSFGRQALLQAEPRVGPQLPLPNTPHFPAATSPRTAPPSPFDLESEGDPDLRGQAGTGVGAFGSPLDDALKQNVSNFASKVDAAAAPAPKPSMTRSESATSSVSLSQMYKEGQGNAQRR